MSDDDATDHRHRNIAAITEYLSDAGIVVTNVDTPDEWDHDVVSFNIVVPPFGPNELRENGGGDE